MSDLRTARVVVTWRCKRECRYCVNHSEKIRALVRKVNVKAVNWRQYDQVLITGGEPLLVPDVVHGLIDRVRNQTSVPDIYMYTALWTEFSWDIVQKIDGTNYTVHRPVDKNSLRRAQIDLSLLHERNSNRLMLDPDIVDDLKIRPTLWKEIRIKRWRPEDECVLPDNEELLDITQEGNMKR